MATKKTAATPVAAPEPTPAPAAPVAETPSTVPNDEATPATESLQAPWHETFGWDQWDGESMDSFPEDVRPVLTRAQDRFKKDYSEKEERLNELKSVYDSIISEMGDPRVKDLEGQLEAKKKWGEGAVKNIGELVAHIRGLEAQVEAENTRRAEAEVESFKQKNAWLFDGGEKEHAASELFSEGFEPDLIPELLRLPTPTLSAAREVHSRMKADGVKDPGRYALDLAKARSQPPPPSESAALISGATAPNPGPTKPGKLPTDATLRDKQAEAIRLRLKKG